jgi:twinkle protein
MNETQYLSQSLTRLRNWARMRNVTVFLIAHPKTMDAKRKEDGSYPVVTPYDISGGAKWYNAGDTIISIWRDYRMDSRAPVEFHVQKVRNRRAAEIGKRDLFWSYRTGCYYGSDHERERAESNAFRKVEKV